jgi:hypothetical protein
MPYGLLAVAAIFCLDGLLNPRTMDSSGFPRSLTMKSRVQTSYFPGGRK